MNIFRRLRILIFSLIVCLLTTRVSAAADLVSAVQLNAKPVSCVALHRGQMCFQKIRFFWETLGDHSYCLYSDTHNRLLYCTLDGFNEFIHEYASETSESFSLRTSEAGPTVASITVTTAWVYRTGKRSSSGWRLF